MTHAGHELRDDLGLTDGAGRELLYCATCSEVVKPDADAPSQAHDCRIVAADATFGTKRAACSCGWTSAPPNRPHHLPRIISAHLRETRKDK